MYDVGKRVGRFGFEVQTSLLLHPSTLEFDPKAKKLGATLASSSLVNLDPAPKGWRWTADPSSGDNYLKPGDQIAQDRAGFFMADHHERHADARGYQTYYGWGDNKYVCFQLELVSDPFDDHYDRASFKRDLRKLYKHGLPQLLDNGLVTAYRPQVTSAGQGTALDRDR